MCLGFGFKHILLILLKSCVSAVLSNLESRVHVVTKADPVSWAGRAQQWCWELILVLLFCFHSLGP